MAGCQIVYLAGECDKGMSEMKDKLLRVLCPASTSEFPAEPVAEEEPLVSITPDPDADPTTDF